MKPVSEIIRRCHRALALATLTGVQLLAASADPSLLRGLEEVSYAQVELRDGFWGSRLKTQLDVTVPHALNSLEKDGPVTHFDNPGMDFSRAILPRDSDLRAEQRAGLPGGGTVLEGGGLVPRIANWPGNVPSGTVSADLIDPTDLLPTFAELDGGKLPGNTIFDGHRFAPQRRGETGKKCGWIYNQLAALRYVRDAGLMERIIL